MNGAEALIRSLTDNGVEVIFGIPGGVMIPIYDALYKQNELKHILMRHEQGAAHAADGYARSTGKVGVCFATSGPGATNTVTGIATAYMDSVPMVIITGQVKTTGLGKDSFQEADITGITMPITKHNYLVKDANDLPRVITEALHIAATGRPGPVLVDIPVDISNTQIDYSPHKIGKMRGYKWEQPIDNDDIDKAVKLINEAEKPILYVGGGVISSNATEALTKLHEKTHIQVTNTLMGKGAIDENHPHSLGMLGMHGTGYANYAVHESDLLIAVGARFDDRVTGKLEVFAPHAKIIHIDVDPAELGKTVSVDVALRGDCSEILERITKKVAKRSETEWNRKIAKLKDEYALVCPTHAEIVHPQCVVKMLSDMTNGEAIVVTDVGQHQMFAALFYKTTKPRRFLSSSGLGTMGYGFPAALGAAAAHPEVPVFAIVGDGGFQMTLQELITAFEQKLPVKVILLNNGFLGMVRQWQELFFDRRYSGVDISVQPDFKMLAEAYGCVGIKIEKMEEVQAALDKAMEIDDRPVVLDFHTNKEENVYPMIPAGMSVQDMMLEQPE